MEECGFVVVHARKRTLTSLVVPDGLTSAAERSRAPRLRSFRHAVGALAGASAVLALVELLAVRAGPLGGTWVGLMIPGAAAAYLVSGLVAWLRRPSSGIGALLVLGGLTWLVTGFSNANAAGLISLGAITATVPLAIVVHLLIGFPSGRLGGRPETALVVAAYTTTVVLQAPLYLFADAPPPYNALQVAARPGVVEAATWVQRGVGLAIMALTAALLVRRLRAATSAQRRVLGPLFGYGVGAVLALPLSRIVVAPALGWSPVTAYVVQLSIAALVPLAFGFSIMRGGFARSTEVEELGAWLGAEPRVRSSLQTALADALGDPTLRLLFWVPDLDVYVDGDGRPAHAPAREPGRALSEVELAGTRVGLITYDPDAVGDRELVRTAGRIVAAGIDRERLTAELLAQQTALRDSRRRIVDAGDRERHRVERNLHDGAQQHITAVIISLRIIELGLAGNEPGTAIRVGRVATDLEGALRELRELARGLSPPLLADVGLTGALESLAERSPIPVQLSVRDVDHLPEPVVVGAYYVVAEALTNAARHSSADLVLVRVVGRDGLLQVEVRDDGRGGARSTPGSGLEGLVDRVEALAGRFALSSPPGAGTSVVAELPCG